MEKNNFDDFIEPLLNNKTKEAKINTECLTNPTTPIKVVNILEDQNDNNNRTIIDLNDQNENNLNENKNENYLRTKIRKSTKNKLTTLLNKNNNQTDLNNESKLTLQKTFTKIVIRNMIYVLTYITIPIINIANIIVLGRSTPDYIDHIIALQLGIVFISTCGLSFVKGSLNAFDALGRQSLHGTPDKWDTAMFYKIFNEARILTVLVYLIIVLPICFTSHHILHFMGYENKISSISGHFIRIYLIAVLLNLFAYINLRALDIMGHRNTVMALNLVALPIHIISLLGLVYSFRLELSGVAFCSLISSGFLYISSSYFVSLYNPCDKSLLEIDTDTLSSTKFYFYAKLAFAAGLSNLIKHLCFDIIIFASFFLGPQETATNVILYNIFGLLYYFITGINNNLSSEINSKLRKSKYVNIIHYVKGSVAVIAFFTLIFIFVLFSFKEKIVFFFVTDEIIISNVSSILNLYCFFIIFDYSSNLLISILKGFNKQTSVNIINSLLILLIFIPLGFIFSFSFKIGFSGFWYSVFIGWIVLTLVNFHFLYQIDFHWKNENKEENLKKLKIDNEIENLIRDHNN